MLTGLFAELKHYPDSKAKTKVMAASTVQLIALIRVRVLYLTTNSTVLQNNSVNLRFKNYSAKNM